MSPVATFHSPFPTKFGIPRQSGLVPELPGRIVFMPPYRDASALRGIEDYDWLWLIWQFSALSHPAQSTVVRPPVLGGNERVGVFATRSPYRPCPIGLSSVRLQHVEWHTPCGPVLHVLGADLMNGTPIYDIKPYIPLADAHPDARAGFSAAHAHSRLSVEVAEGVAQCLTPAHLSLLRETVALDPRPRYQNDPQRVYTMPFMRYEVRFRVADGTAYVLSATTEPMPAPPAPQ